MLQQPESVQSASMTDYRKWDKMAAMLDDDGSDDEVCPAPSYSQESASRTNRRLRVQLHRVLVPAAFRAARCW